MEISGKKYVVTEQETKKKKTTQEPFQTVSISGAFFIVRHIY